MTEHHDELLDLNQLIALAVDPDDARTILRGASALCLWEAEERLVMLRREREGRG